MASCQAPARLSAATEGCVVAGAAVVWVDVSLIGLSGLRSAASLFRLFAQPTVTAIAHVNTIVRYMGRPFVRHFRRRWYRHRQGIVCGFFEVCVIGHFHAQA